MSFGYRGWKPYVPVAQRRAKAAKNIERMQKKDAALQPVQIAGSTIARSFWGKGWCQHLETFSDFENRLPRGRSYVRSGAVCHLEIDAGRIRARVIGSSLYDVEAHIATLDTQAWNVLKKQCAGGIGSMIELLQGQLSGEVMRIVTDPAQGLFPKPGEMKFSCSCPDWADMCKHVAATLYGVGNRLDQQPELLFRLRGVDPAELIEAGLSTPTEAGAATPNGIADDQLSAIFGIEFEQDDVPPPTSTAARSRQRTGARKSPVRPAKKAAKKTAKKPAAAARPFRATGRSIRTLRRTLGLSVDDLAIALSVSPTSVRRWEAAGTAALKLQARCLAGFTLLHHRAARAAARR